MNETRQLFHLLAQVGSELHQESGITASTRAVMEALFPDHEMSVPEIARAKNVTRQHIQTIVNDLLSRDLAQAIDNPAHKRSVLIRLTPLGQLTFKTISSREKKLLLALASEFNEQQLTQATTTLKALRKALESRHWRSQLTA